MRLRIRRTARCYVYLAILLDQVGACAAERTFTVQFQPEAVQAVEGELLHDVVATSVRTRALLPRDGWAWRGVDPAVQLVVNSLKTACDPSHEA